MAQTVKVSKWGDSLAVRIPRDIAREFHITAGKRLRVTYVDGKIILQVQKTHNEEIREWLHYIEVHDIHPDE